MKILKQVFAVVGVAVLLVGCASDEKNSGAMGNGSETTVYHDNNNSDPATPPSAAPFGNEPAGPNGSVSRNNPFGMGPGNDTTGSH